MGYESRIYIINRTKGKFAYDECLAMFNLSSIDDELLQVLRKKEYCSPSKCYGDEASTDLYIGSGMEIIKKDPYGGVPTECSLMEFYSTLSKYAVHNSCCYRRYEMVLGFILPLIHSTQWNELIVVHTGY